VVGAGGLFRPQGFDNEEANFLESHEARTGTVVRVLDGGKRPGKGRVGKVVERTFGHPSHLAMDVRFEDGSVELYWYHELGRTEVSSSA